MGRGDPWWKGIGKVAVIKACWTSGCYAAVVAIVGAWSIRAVADVYYNFAEGLLHEASFRGQADAVLLSLEQNTM